MKRPLRPLSRKPQTCQLFAGSASAEQAAYISDIRPNTLL